MTRKKTFSLGLALLLGALAFGRWAPTPSQAQEAKPPAPKQFVGSKKCKKCHLPEFKGWEKTPHARAFDVLAPGAAEKEKKAAGLSLTTDYRKDASCVGCHTVGFGHTAGFSLEQDISKDKRRLLGVGCESCHGPGKGVLGKGKKDRDYKAARKSRLPGLLEAGYVPAPAEKDCKRCHNEKSPSFSGFEFETMKDKGVHKVPAAKPR